MKQHRFARLLAGVSLIEALVALAVMAFGMLGVVGMQSTLRSNADLSRQRAEAVRLAQEESERIRNFSVLRTADKAAGQQAFDEIASVAPAALAASAANATFSREVIVPLPAADDPPVRHVQVVVTWRDRTGQDHFVDLFSLVSAFPPELSALPAMRTDRGPLQQPQGRNPSIPRGAVDQGDGTSRFVPPGGPTDRSWIFSNVTGLITQICQPADTCTATSRLLLSGILAFATGAAPTSAEAAAPGDSAFAVGMAVRLSQPALPDEPCVTELTATRVNYYCAVPTTASGFWVGQVLFSGFPKATTLAETGASLFKVCRYTPDDRNFAGSVPPTGESNDYFNGRHPFSYLFVDSPQVNKNFLIISAGDDETAYGCPDEDTATLIETNTWPHDPAS